eukprot:TRINITY_DN12113_c0_g1_i1.p2 TRINITY_DN12113_c0_g1~~TRINITY_DN12113_c0_g1_i1.p2  ORF type:complete len:109 (-),score=9.57 TRINITY_DN12113_c0_g1_i1:104-430(-)
MAASVLRSTALRSTHCCHIRPNQCTLANSICISHCDCSPVTALQYINDDSRQRIACALASTRRAPCLWASHACKSRQLSHDRVRFLFNMIWMQFSTCLLYTSPSPRDS